jgi:serine phosphatase RsbU (regulator of sigma subunit)/predicted enzyme related to lactoylglutathione lyase
MNEGPARNPSPRRPEEYTVRLDSKEPYLRIVTVNIFVRDHDRSLHFYIDQLGFHLVFDAKLDQQRRWVAVAPPDGTALLTLVVPEPHSAEYKLIGRRTGVVFVTEDFNAKFNEWHRRGIRFHTPRLKHIKYQHRDGTLEMGEPAHQESPVWGGVITHFRDVDGNSFSLVSFDEVTREVEQQRRAVAEKLEAERRVARELEIAREFQARLFPQVLPPLQTLEYAGVCKQAHQVGGDYYDFLNLGQARLGMVLGDISGKGIAAALLMANLQANLRSQCTVALDRPDLLLRSVNQLFCENTTAGAYATLLFAEYDDHTRRLRYANCGHPPALLLRANGALERLSSTCTVMGLFKKWDCPVEDRFLSQGDTLALYSDGITEAYRGDREEFGEERLVEALRRHQHEPAQAVVASIVGEVQRFSAQQHDDVTLIVAKCRD